VPRVLASRSASTLRYSTRKSAAATQSGRLCSRPSSASRRGPMPRSAARSSRSRSWAAKARVRTACRSPAGHRSAASGALSSRMSASCSAPVSSRGAGSPRWAAAIRSRPNAYAGNVRTTGSVIALVRPGAAPPAPADPPAWAPMRASIRLRSAAEALRPNVSTRMWLGSVPSATRAATASTRVVVLPVPGPPTTRSGPSRWATTARCSASSGTAAGASSSARRTRRYRGAGVRDAVLVVTPSCNHARPTIPSTATRGVGPRSDRSGRPSPALPGQTR